MITELPMWKDVQQKADEDQPLSALDQFIYDWEPVGTEDEVDFRMGLLGVVQEAQGTHRDD